MINKEDNWDDLCLSMEFDFDTGSYHSIPWEHFVATEDSLQTMLSFVNQTFFKDALSFQIEVEANEENGFKEGLKVFTKKKVKDSSVGLIFMVPGIHGQVNIEVGFEFWKNFLKLQYDAKYYTGNLGLFMREVMTAFFNKPNNELYPLIKELNEKNELSLLYKAKNICYNAAKENPKVEALSINKASFIHRRDFNNHTSSNEASVVHSEETNPITQENFDIKKTKLTYYSRNAKGEAFGYFLWNYDKHHTYTTHPIFNDAIFEDKYVKGLHHRTTITADAKGMFNKGQHKTTVANIILSNIEIEMQQKELFDTV